VLDATHQTIRRHEPTGRERQSQRKRHHAGSISDRPPLLSALIRSDPTPKPTVLTRRSRREGPWWVAGGGRVGVGRARRERRAGTNTPALASRGVWARYVPLCEPGIAHPALEASAGENVPGLRAFAGPGDGGVTVAGTGGVTLLAAAGQASLKVDMTRKPVHWESSGERRVSPASARDGDAAVGLARGARRELPTDQSELTRRDQATGWT
jgi:hypothetical protein